MARSTLGRNVATACLLLTLAAFLVSIPAVANEDVKIEIKDAQGFAGGEVSVSVTMDADIRPSAVAFWVEYDDSVLTFLDATPGLPVTLAGKDVSWGFPAPGRISFGPVG